MNYQGYQNISQLLQQKQSQGIQRNYNGMPIIPQPTLMALSAILTIGPYKHRKDLTRESVLAKYQILGYIAAGTYGKVYKAKSKRTQEKGSHEELQQIGGSDISGQNIRPQPGQQRGLSGATNLVNNGVNVVQPGHLPLTQRPGQSVQDFRNRDTNASDGRQGDMDVDLTGGTGAGSGAGGAGIGGAGAGGAGGSLHTTNQNGTVNNQPTSKVSSAGTLTITEGSKTSTGGRIIVGGSAGNNTDESNEQLFAIKKFKNDSHQSSKNYNHDINGNEILHYTGISQSAIREMSICREISNKNVTKTIDILLENKSIYIVSEFCEHDLLQIIHFHSHPDIRPINEKTVKSLIWQILNGVLFLHKNWIFHRDLKPANIMVTSSGVVKIGDLGLARKFNNPLQSLYTGDKVVVTIWYRAPELLLGSRNYSPSIDLWAVGCILAELLSLRPIFKGEETKIDMSNKKLVPFQTNQFQKIVEILGTPTVEIWPTIIKYPEYASFKLLIPATFNPNLANWYKAIGGNSKSCLNLLQGLLEYDPLKRLTSENALLHHFFLEAPKVTEHAFEGLHFQYPKRRIYTDDNDIISGNNAGKRHGFDNSKMRKRQR